MILGHYVTALIPHSRERSAPLSLYLFAAMFQDFLWLLFATLGLEPTSPRGVLDASFARLRVEMTYSHDLVPALGWALAAGLLGLVVTHRAAPALWCAGLCIGHEVLDLLSGFHHHLAGPGTVRIGLGLYRDAPYGALLIEAVFCAGVVLAYVRSEAGQGRRPSIGKQVALFVLFVLGTLALLPGAERPLASWL